MITFSDVPALLMATESERFVTQDIYSVHKKMKEKNKGELESCMHDKH